VIKLYIESDQRTILFAIAGVINQTAQVE